MTLYLNESAARRRFKDLLGNANHLLITILVGLSAVEQRLIVEAPAHLRTTWNPRNPVASASRSRILVLEMTVVRATDALDAYITLCRREPALLQDVRLQNAIDAEGQSVLGKFKALKASFGSKLNPIICALVEVMIVWRNRLVHTLAEPKLSPDVQEFLNANSAWILNEFRGMGVDRLFADFERGGPPTFKEMASFIRATQIIVESLDLLQLCDLDTELYLRSFIIKTLKESKLSDGSTLPIGRAVQNLWGRDEEGKRRRLQSFLVNKGFSPHKASSGGCQFPDELLDRFASMSAKDVLALAGGKAPTV